MSHIPNSAMPHAGHIEPVEDNEPRSRRARARERAGELVRDHPKTSAAAGAALIAGIAAAAAIPFLSARDRKKTSASPKRPAAAKKSANGKTAAPKAPAAKKRSAPKRTSRAKSSAQKAN